VRERGVVSEKERLREKQKERKKERKKEGEKRERGMKINISSPNAFSSC